MANSKLIVIEGLDGVGKNTQSKLLVEYLSKTYGDTILYSFPRYHSPTGMVVANYLNGGLNDLTILEKAKLYADDRLAVREAMVDSLNRGLNVVCDRYVFSNLYFVAMAALAWEDNECENKDYPALTEESIFALEYGYNRLPVPDLTLVLECPVEISIEMVKQKAKRDYTDEKQDRHERDIRLLEKVAQIYTKAAAKYPRTKSIWCGDNQTNSVLPVSSIENMIREYVDVVMKKETAMIYSHSKQEVNEIFWPSANLNLF